ncbi:response regulator transcription factor [Paenibacillus aestuarii]|uniref:Helix-turn-helix domain-containing protein n=1 Tax=Paenibacillus aestuarii TaxID=516965 RepID=A0ABW0KAF8_9BACL|nr:helix-turn-helix domain-containing protein [Paenibacillus aestuarii]
MYELMIVDDEWYAARGVANGIDWSKLGFSYVHVATNISRAKEIINERQIDVIICDIEMPMGNGIELLEWINERGLAIRTLLLTCHTEFEYAKKAVQLGTLDYLVKPIRYEDLASIMEKVVARMSEDRQKEAFLQMLRANYDSWLRHQPLVIERFWTDVLLYNGTLNELEIRDMIADKHIPFRPSARFIPILFSIRGCRKELPLRAFQAMAYALRKEMEETIFQSGMTGQAIHPSSAHLLAVLPIDHDQIYNLNQLKDNCQRFINKSNEQFYCDVACYIGEPVELKKVKAEVERLYERDAGNVTIMNQVSWMIKDKGVHVTKHKPDFSTWLQLLKKGGQDELLAEIDEFIATLQKDGCSLEQLKEICQDFLQMSHHVLQLKELHAGSVFGDNAGIAIAGAARSIDNFRSWVHEIVVTAIEAIRSVEQSQTIVERVDRYIMDNLDRGLSRESIAEHVCLNPDYLNRFFKKETGHTISEFILERRIKVAKEKLMNSSMSVANVAASIGYANFSHFSMIFKRATGVTPAEYRKKT